MFDSVFQNGTTAATMALMAGLALASGVAYALISSLRLRASKGFFVTASLLPLIVGVGMALLAAFLDSVESQVARIATIAIALGLIRFRSVNGKAEEMLMLLGAVVSGLVFGLGFVAYAVIFTLLFAALYVLLTYLPLFKNRRFAREKLLKITIPESLDYSGVFNDTFAHYLKEYELVEVKTTGMGSMFRLSYRVVLKNASEEKELIDELRIRNGNLEISLLPYTEPNKQL